MAWTYSTWITETTTAGRESQLRQHIVEVSNAISAKMMSDGTSVDPSTLTEYLGQLRAELKDLRGGGSKITRGRVIKL